MNCKIKTTLVLLILSLFSKGAYSSDNPDQIEAAGCLIVTPDGFVMAVNRLINRLQLPIGHHIHGESARETASRETREETGLDVTVGEIAIRLKQNRVVFFFCTPINPDITYDNLTPIDRVEVSRAMVVNPVDLKTTDGSIVRTRWRYPEMRWILRSVFEAAYR